MSNPFGEDGANAAQVTVGPGTSGLPSRDAAALVQALPDDEARAKYANHCSRIEKTLSQSEHVIALALCMSGKPGILALTNQRLLFAYKPDGLTPMGVSENALSNIASARPARDGLLVARRDTGKEVGYQMAPELGQTFVRGLQSLGIAQAVPQAAPAAPASPHGALRVLPEKTKKLVLQHIAPDEWVFLAFVGAQGQSLVALADRLLIAKTGFMSGNTFGGQASTFPYREITGIDIQTHMTTAVLQVQTASFAGISPSYWSHDKNADPFKLPNCLPLPSKKAVAQWQANLATLRRGIAAGGFVDPRRAPTPAPQPAAAPAAPPAAAQAPGVGSLADELKKMAEMRDAGLLTDEEFAQAKAKLLG